MEVRARTLVIRIDMQLRSSRERGHRHFAVHRAACVLVGRGHRRSGNERSVELCRYVGPDLARMKAIVPQSVRSKIIATNFWTRGSSMREKPMQRVSRYPLMP